MPAFEGRLCWLAPFQLISPMAVAGSVNFYSRRRSRNPLAHPAGTALVWAVLLLLLPLAAGCSREPRARAIGEGYVSASSVTLRDRLGAGSSSVATVQGGERVEILQRRRRSLRVRTAAGVEGWLEERHIIGNEIYERAQQLLRETVARPSQGRAQAHELVNLHLEPSRPSPRLFQLQQGETCDVLEHRAVERPLPPGAPPPTTPEPARKGKKRRTSGPKMEDWFLVRAKGKAGWALARFIDMAVPSEVARFAEGRAITAWQVLSEVQDDGEKKPEYLWATSQKVGSPYDFDGIRVITWNTARNRYQLAYQEWNLSGVYPLAVGREPIEDGEVPTFAVTTLDREGKRVTRHFVLLGNKVRRKE